MCVEMILAVAQACPGECRFRRNMNVPAGALEPTVGFPAD
jgi:hypothetical protein